MEVRWEIISLSELFCVACVLKLCTVISTLR